MTFLCDRETTNIAESQPGFHNFIVLPLWQVAVEIMPEMKRAHINAIATRDAWVSYKETEQDKSSYAIKTKAPRKESLNQLGSPTGAVEEEESFDADCDDDPYSDEDSIANSVPKNKSLAHPKK